LEPELVKRALLTGASGFVGANLARRLLNDGHEVHLILRPNHDPWRVREIREHVVIHEVNLADSIRLDASVASIRPDWIFHLATYGAYPDQRDVGNMICTNVQGTANLIQAAEQCGFAAFINSGTSSEYGLKDHAPSEDESLEPNSYYAVTKAAATLLCRHVAQRKGLPIVTLRLYSAYGPYEQPGRLVPTLIVHGLEGRLPPLVNPSVARDYVHVDDVCEAYLLSAASAERQAGSVFNVGTGVQTTLREIVSIIRKLLAIDAEPAWGTMPERSWDTDIWIARPDLIKAILGWSPRFDVERGLEETIAWFRRNPQHLAAFGIGQ
jgi:nucleoside-diphosphate-sugar epimerase